LDIRLEGSLAAPEATLEVGAALLVAAE